MRANQAAAYSFLILAQVAIGINVIIGKYIIEEVPTFLFLEMRFLVSSLLLTLLHWGTRHSRKNVRHSPVNLQVKDWAFLTAQAATGGFLFNFLFFWGIEYTSATAASIICSTLPAIIAVCAYWCLGEKLTKKNMLALLLAMLGILVISLSDAQNLSDLHGSLFGDFLILLSMIPEALYSIFSKFIGNRLTPLASAMRVNWLVFFMLLPLCYLALPEINVPSYTWQLASLMIGSGACGAFFFWAWPKGLLSVAASTAAIFGGVMPVVASICAYFFLGEHFGLYDVLGLILVFASLAVGTNWRYRVS